MKEMLRKLAETYPQLNIAPGPGGTEKYRDAVLRGIRPPEDLSHFTAATGTAARWSTRRRGTYGP